MAFIVDISIQNGVYCPGVFRIGIGYDVGVNFSASTTHALRAMAWLAAHTDGEAMLGRDLARKLKIPPDYLSKVLATLARSGVLTASRGAKGGYRLARAAESG
jgi:Rrf2 family protein